MENYYPIILNADDSSKINDDCYNNLFPIPNFWQSKFYNNESECNLEKGFKIYVLDSKPGIYVEEKYLSKYAYLPKKWEHGFSKGVAISEEQMAIIYWVIAW